MPIRVSPTEPKPTHHVSLEDRKGRKVGLILVDSKGKNRPAFRRSPVDRTSFKTASGNMTYADFDYPYTPIAQDNWMGGRASLDFERDTTRFLDSYRLRTSKSNKVYLGPQEQYTSGAHLAMMHSVPKSVRFHVLTGTKIRLAKRFQATSTFTAGHLWVMLKRAGQPANVTLRILTDSTGSPGSEVDSVEVAYTRMPDILSEWVVSAVSAAIATGSNYWVEVEASSTDTSEKHWEVAVKGTAGSTKVWNGTTWESVNFDLYFRLTEGGSDSTIIPFAYQEQQYVVISGSSGAPKIYMNGDRGAADANTGQLNKLIDATKDWPADVLTGAVCMIIGGPGRLEDRPYRVVEGNDNNTLDFSSDPWTLEHTTATEYVVIGADFWQEIGAGAPWGTHGLTAPVTDVLVSSQGVVYFCMGDTVNIKRHRQYNNSGTWTADWADDGTNKAVFLAYSAQQQKIWRGQNSDATGIVSVSSSDPKAWASNLDFAAVKAVGSKYVRITRLGVYLDDGWDEAIWAMKEDIPYIVPSSGNPYPLGAMEMATVRSLKNGRAVMWFDYKFYFSLMNGLEEYYDGKLRDMGPTVDEGMPPGRQGPVVALLGYPGKFMAVIDAGADGYSSILMYDKGGWHEHYRAPKGRRIRSVWFQVLPGPTPDRLYFYQGNDLMWLPFPSETLNELDDSAYLFTHEGAIEFSRMHAGMMDTLKLVKSLKLMTENLAKGVCWIEADYRLDSETDWTPFPQMFYESPVQEVGLEDIFGLAGKRIMLRLRFYTTDASQTPVLMALVLEAVSRIKVKRLYDLATRVADNDKDLQGEPDDIKAAMEKLALLEEWTDDTALSMLRMRSTDPLYDDRLVFLQPTAEHLLREKQVPDDERQNPAWLVTLTAQDA